MTYDYIICHLVNTNDSMMFILIDSNVKIIFFDINNHDKSHYFTLYITFDIRIRLK